MCILQHNIEGKFSSLGLLLTQLSCQEIRSRRMVNTPLDFVSSLLVYSYKHHCLYGKDKSYSSKGQNNFSGQINQYIDGVAIPFLREKEYHIFFRRLFLFP